jgi:DNA-binding NarL/FixJ family response regulator
MDYAQVLILLALICASAAAVCCGLMIAADRRARRSAFRTRSAAAAAEKRLAAAEKKLKMIAAQSSNQARRIAWLELRLRREKPESQPQAADEPVEAEDPSQTSMTERRHRVLSLARRGMNSELIAETLGVPHGEVELIISLNMLS